MININELVQTSGWRKFMAKLYGWGASVVIIGALFKLMHWPGASFMLIIGLGTEAVIFFFSAFEPLHEEIDWTLVYPELAGMTDLEELEDASKDGVKAQAPVQSVGELIDMAAFDPNTISKLGQGLEKLSSTANGIASVADGSVATQDYYNNMKSAAAKLEILSTSYLASNDSIKDAANQIQQSYQAAAGKISQAGDQVAVSYQKLAETIGQDQANIIATSKQYSGGLDSINKNVSALNAVYELQLKNTNDYLASSKSVYTGLIEMNGAIKNSADEAAKYRDVFHKLNENLATLNNVYGNMLSSLSVVSN